MEPESFLPPRGIGFSGGGLRAAMGSRHLCYTLDHELKQFSYVATLSGSTWFLTHSLYRTKNAFPPYYAENDLALGEFDKFDSSLWEKYMAYHEHSKPLKSLTSSNSFLVDALTNLLGYAYFYDHGWRRANRSTDFDFNAQLNVLPRKPLLTCIGTERKYADRDPNDWNFFEITPSAVQETGLDFLLPIEKLGLSDACLESVNQLPAIMALCGSAPCKYTDVASNIFLSENQTIFSSFESRFKNNEVYCFRDAGHFSNLPLLPLLDPEKGLAEVYLLDMSMHVHDRPWCHVSRALKALSRPPYASWNYRPIDEKWLRHWEKCVKNNPSPWRDDLLDFEKLCWISDNTFVLSLTRGDQKVKIVVVPAPAKDVSTEWQSSEESRKLFRGTIEMAAIHLHKKLAEY